MLFGHEEMDLVQACEERLVNLWPAAVTLMMEGWVIRMAHGYSGRANSASALVPGARFDTISLTQIEGLYRDAGLVPCVRVTPLADPSVAELLATRGYRFKDRAIGMIAKLDPNAAHVLDPDIRLDLRPPRAWAESISSFQEPSKRSPDHLLSIVGAIRLPAAFATLSQADAPVGYAYCGVDRGLAEIGSVMIHPDHRGNGCGRRLMQALMGFAAGQGATSVFLQVAETNASARHLYRALGFRDIYSYDTMVL
jgi:N-acetylglutamate synthase